MIVLSRGAVSCCRVVAGTPASDPDLWQVFLTGAQQAYAAHKVLRALEYEHIATGSGTGLFFLVADRDGNAVGGVRCQGPYLVAAQAHAVVEWAGCLGQDAVRRSVQRRLVDGVVECKTGWVAENSTNRAAIGEAV